ncbi:MAG: protein translocase subunit SecD [Magnetococcales bacterium]|nr:protein translocase subunit SecD [Magnetococcales bacterium]NGZ27475.1 protein translocase subunit SecD [Magnetococcales bacterium]
MRHVPLWKLLGVLLLVVPSIFYAMPTFVGGMPDWWPKWLPNQQIHRGLDLQGGLHLLLHVETDKAVEQAAENLVDQIRGTLRDKRLRHKGVERQGLDTVVLHFEMADVAKIREALSQEISRYNLREEGETFYFTLPKVEQDDLRQFAVEQSMQTIRSRIDQFGVAEPTIQRQGADRILLQMPGLQDLSRAKSLIGRTARLEFKMLDEKGDLASALSGKIPPGDVLLYGDTKDKTTGQTSRHPYLVKKRTVLSGDLLVDARVNIDQRFNEPYVQVTFNALGGRKFADLTGEHVGERMAIVLDGKVYSAPVIREKIDGGRAQITGSFTHEEARDLAIVLRAGALPAPVTIMEERTVGPTLGSDSIEAGILSCLIGFGFVVAFMLFYYKAFGILANLAVLFNLVMLVAAMVALEATLTVPGIAGVVLTIGMAVDANVLINERIREELRLGLSPLAAIDRGYDKAFLTIWDSNLTTLFTGIILYQFGTGSVRGFAVTLSIGIIISMFTSITVTRMMLMLFLGNRRVQRLSI